MAPRIRGSKGEVCRHPSCSGPVKWFGAFDYLVLTSQAQDWGSKTGCLTRFEEKVVRKVNAVIDMVVHLCRGRCVGIIYAPDRTWTALRRQKPSNNAGLAMMIRITLMVPAILPLPLSSAGLLSPAVAT